MNKKTKKIIIWTILAPLLLLVLTYVGGIIWQPTIPEWRINAAKRFCKDNNLNERYAIFVDFSLPSGIPRYIIYDLDKKEIIYRCLCASGKNEDKYSNIPDSHLSSLGKYRVTAIIHRMRIGRDGIVIEGLEPTNSDAKSRMILIHHSKTLDSFPKSIFPLPIMGRNISRGCFAITTEGVNLTRKLHAPLLLWAYR